MALIKMRDRWYIEHSEELRARLKELQNGGSLSHPLDTPSGCLESPLSTGSESFFTPPTTTSTVSSCSMETNTSSSIEEPAKDKELKVSPVLQVKIDVAFVQDARWKGTHPAKLDANTAHLLDKRMPVGFRYAREMQNELCFFPPTSPDRRSPFGTFILQKPGSKAVPIISPAKDTDPLHVKNRRQRVIVSREKLDVADQAHLVDCQNIALSMHEKAQTHLTRPITEISSQTPILPGQDRKAAANDQSYSSDTSNRFASLGSALKVYGSPHLIKAYGFSSTIMAGQH